MKIKYYLFICLLVTISIIVDTVIINNIGVNIYFSYLLIIPMIFILSKLELILYSVIVGLFIDSAISSVLGVSSLILIIIIYSIFSIREKIIVKSYITPIILNTFAFITIKLMYGIIGYFLLLSDSFFHGIGYSVLIQFALNLFIGFIVYFIVLYIHEKFLKSYNKFI